MIFITLGSQKFQFDRLLKKIDELIEKELISDKVTAQIGASEYLPKNYEYQRFMNQEDFNRCIEESNLVITHGGTGVIINAIKRQKKVIAVPRRVQFSEHVDDHQIQIIKKFDDMNLICACFELEELEDCICKVDQKQYRKYVSNTQAIIDSIEEYLQTLV